MSKLITLAAISAAFVARNPSPTPGQIGAIAAGEEGELDEVQAGFRPFTATSGALKIVKAAEHFLVAGVTILKGDLVELEEAVAKRLIANGQAVAASADEIAAAQADAEKPAKGK